MKSPRDLVLMFNNWPSFTYGMSVGPLVPSNVGCFVLNIEYVLEPSQRL